MLVKPADVVFQHALGRVFEPRIALAPFIGNFVHGVVDGLVPVAENRPVGAELIIARPER